MLFKTHVLIKVLRAYTTLRSQLLALFTTILVLM
jgi:hypothetical protein